jgi:hypothetical protein
MIFINPESNINKNVAIVGAEILLLLKKRNYIIDSLIEQVIKKNDELNEEIIFDTLTFLYVIDLIKVNEYRISLND